MPLILPEVNVGLKAFLKSCKHNLIQVILPSHPVTFHSCPLVRSRDLRLWSDTESAWAENESKLFTMIFFKINGSAMERYGVDMSYWPHTLPNLDNRNFHF